MEKLDKKNIEDIFSLTPMQEGMLFHYLKSPQSELYFEQLSLEISGKIDVERFEKAWNFIIETNEMLRTVFRWEKIENPIQIILKEHKIQPGYYDLSLSGKVFDEKKKRLEEIKVREREEKFDLREVPFRITLCNGQEDKYDMIISNFHILYDGWSNGIILKEFFKAYDDLSKGKKLVKPVKTKFKEFVKLVRNQDLKRQETYWRGYLKGFETLTEISINHRKGKENTSRGKYRIRCGKEMKDKLEDFVRKHKITLASFLYVAWGLLLQKYNNSDDVIFGTTVSGRSAKLQGIEEMVGLFINTLPLRIQTNSNEKTGDLLNRIDKALKMREEYSTTSLVNIKEYSEINNKEELFDNIVIIENYPLANRLILEESKLTIDSYSMVEMTHYDLTVGIFINDDIEVNFTYNKEIFEKDNLVRLFHQLKLILQDIIKNPGKEIPEIEIISEKERNQILYEFNDTEAEYPKDKTIHELFEEQAEKNSDKIAVLGVER
jgi:iturin family lipopeptide synthetase B